MEPKMFCFQCQETAGNKGCMFGGVCGKKPETANLQDLLIYVTKGLSEITTRLRSEGKEIPAAIDRLITTNLFMTITNANFDDDRFIDRINETLSSRDELFEQLHDDTGLSDAASWQYRTAEERTLKADKVGVLDTGNEDLRSLRELTLYGLKGMAAYNKHQLRREGRERGAGPQDPDRPAVGPLHQVRQQPADPAAPAGAVPRQDGAGRQQGYGCQGKGRQDRRDRA